MSQLPISNKEELGAVGVGGLAAIGHFCHMVEPVLADLSYLAAIIVGGLTIFYKIKNRDRRGD